MQDAFVHEITAQGATSEPLCKAADGTERRYRDESVGCYYFFTAS